MAEAVHISKKSNDGGSNHAVGLGDLRVMIVQEAPNAWYAQGIEIDYIAQGESLEAAKKSFERGLELTITEHLRAYGNIEKLLQPAPQDVWAEFFKSDGGRFKYSQVSKHKLNIAHDETVLVATTKPAKKASRKPAKKPSKQPLLPFDQITYLAQCA